MRYNVYDLYEGSVRGDRLKEIAIKLDYAKPAKTGQGVNGASNDINEAQLLSGLQPSILALLKFEVKFKNNHGVPISELIQDIHFKNAIFNVAINAARLEKQVIELKQLHHQQQAIIRAIEEVTQLIEKDKQAEKQRVEGNIALQRQIEAQNEQLRIMMADYLQQRAEKIKALEETIKELNARERELIKFDKEILAKASQQYATKLDEVKNAQGQPIFANVSDEAKQKYAEGVMDDVFKIERKYDKKEKAIDIRISDIDSKIKDLKAGNGKASAFNTTNGTVSTAFQLHSGRKESAPQIAELEKERKDLVKEKEGLEVQKEAEITEAVRLKAKEAGVENLSDEDVQILKTHLQDDNSFKDMLVSRMAVHEEVEMVQELREKAAKEILSEKQLMNETITLSTLNDSVVPIEFTVNDELEIDDDLAAMLAMMEEEESALLNIPEETLDASMRAKAN